VDDWEGVGPVGIAVKDEHRGGCKSAVRDCSSPGNGIDDPGNGVRGKTRRRCGGLGSSREEVKLIVAVAVVVVSGRQNNERGSTATQQHILFNLVALEKYI